MVRSLFVAIGDAGAGAGDGGEGVRGLPPIWG